MNKDTMVNKNKGGRKIKQGFGIQLKGYLLMAWDEKPDFNI